MNKTTTNKSFGIMDIISIFQLSIRSAFWRIDKKQIVKGSRSNIMGFTVFFVGILTIFMVLTPILNIYYILSIEKIYNMIVLTLAFPLIFFGIYNPQKLIYNLQYIRTAWYKNTGILPFQVTTDRGTYGEYVATKCAEQCLMNNDAKGYIFNNVVVPKKDGDFNEIDIISVSEMGIHVIEAKARLGTFSGGFLSPEWIQTVGREKFVMQNPIIQNLAHINYLVQYIYEQLPECELKHKCMHDKMTNVVLFTVTGIEDQLDRSRGLSMSMIFGMAEEYYRIREFNKDVLSKEEVEMIADILKKISSYSQGQLTTMMHEREKRQNNKDFSHPYNYYLVRVKNGYASTEDNLICRDNGYYTTYYNFEDEQFYLFPEYEIIGKSKPTDSFNEILNYYKTL